MIFPQFGVTGKFLGAALWLPWVRMELDVSQARPPPCPHLSPAPFADQLLAPNPLEFSTPLIIYLSSCLTSIQGHPHWEYCRKAHQILDKSLLSQIPKSCCASAPLASFLLKYVLLFPTPLLLYSPGAQQDSAESSGIPPIIFSAFPQHSPFPSGFQGGFFEEF